jgi:succinate dehydrogenase cytochrome b subunit
MSASTMPARVARPRSAGRLRRFWDSTIGKKVVMAGTGLIGIGFVVGHMAGNLQMFEGNAAPQAMHDYAVFLRNTEGLLWVVRAVLLGAVGLHVVAAWQLTVRNRAARPTGYARRRSQVSTLASRSMRVGGVLLLAFLVFHLLDLTLGVANPDFRHLDPYHNMQASFARWWVVVFYVAAVAALGLHLYHGAWASFRTLGARRPSTRPLHRNVAVLVALLVALGFAAVPLAAALGMFRENVVPVSATRPAPSPAATGAGGAR